MAMQRLSRGKLYVQIAHALRTLIEEGQWRPGEKLPTLAQLAGMYGCSRATVREALGALRGQGLVEFRHGDGTYVRTATVEMWMEPLEAAILLGTSQARQLVELLIAILAGIASLAAEHVQDIDMGPLKHALFQVECAGPIDEEAVATELSFFLTMTEVLGNNLMENALRVLQEAMRSVMRLVHETGETGTETCRLVFDAVAAGDPVAARQVVYDYGTQLLQSLRSSSPDA